jgi:UDP-N-acetyl-D-galactosamine dehydrogenase
MLAELRSFGIEVAVHDPVAQADEAEHEYGVRLARWEDLPRADALIVAVAHRAFLSLGPAELGTKLAPGGCFVDVKSRFDRAAFERAGFNCWRL